MTTPPAKTEEEPETAAAAAPLRAVGEEKLALSAPQSLGGKALNASFSSPFGPQIAGLNKKKGHYPDNVLRCHPPKGPSPGIAFSSRVRLISGSSEMAISSVLLRCSGRGRSSSSTSRMTGSPKMALMRSKTKLADIFDENKREGCRVSQRYWCCLLRAT